MKTSKISAKDLELFHQAAGLVKPLAGSKRYQPSSQKKLPDPALQAKRLNAEGKNNNPYIYASNELINSGTDNFFDDTVTEYVQIGYGTDLIRDLKRGKWLVQVNLDLHGYTMDNALISLDRFIASCVDNNIRCVRIIHGKGIGSPSGKAILKSAVRNHLSRLKSVQAWIQAKEKDGGSGAIIALIRYKK